MYKQKLKRNSETNFVLLFLDQNPLLESKSNYLLHFNLELKFWQLFFEEEGNKKNYKNLRSQ